MLNMKKTFSRIGFAMFLFLAVSNISSVIIALLCNFISPGILHNTDWNVFISFVSTDVIGLAVFWLVAGKLQKTDIPHEKMGFKLLVSYFAVCFAVSVAGAVAGTAVSYFLSGGTAENYVSELMENPGFFLIIDVVFLAPFAEELICRKLIIDRTVRFGEKMSVVFSAVVFGFMHGNFYQFFYAFGIGLILGYVYVRSGKMRYTFLLHAVFNFFCGVLPVFLPAESVLPALAEWIFIIFGMVMTFVLGKKVFFKKTVSEFTAGNVFKSVYLNAGMLAFSAAVLFEFVLSLL